MKGKRGGGRKPLSFLPRAWQSRGRGALGKDPASSRGSKEGWKIADGKGAGGSCPITYTSTSTWQGGDSILGMSKLKGGFWEWCLGWRHCFGFRAARAPAPYQNHDLLFLEVCRKLLAPRSCAGFVPFCPGFDISRGFEFHHPAERPLLLFLQIALVLSPSIHRSTLKAQGRGGFSTAVPACVFSKLPRDNIKHALMSLFPPYTLIL